MENASKALIMAGSVLVGIMILSLAVYLFQTFGNYSAETVDTITERQIAQFNSQFFKYYSGTNSVDPIICTAHDIVTVSNLAKESNKSHGFTGKQGERSDGSFYIEVQVKGKGANFQRKSDQELADFIKESTNIIRNRWRGTTSYERVYLYHYRNK